MFTNPLTSIMGLIVAICGAIGSFFPETQGTVTTIATTSTAIGLALSKDGVGKGGNQ